MKKEYKPTILWKEFPKRFRNFLYFVIKLQHINPTHSIKSVHPIQTHPFHPEKEGKIVRSYSA